MGELQIKVQLESSTLLGSGEGLGSTIDADIVFDDRGLPYLPARRLKGLLRENLQEVLEMLDLSQIKLFTGLDVNRIFGTGSAESQVEFYNLYLVDYQTTRDWLEWAFGAFSRYLSAGAVVDTLTEIRQQTAIEKGIADDNSLRTLRVLKPGYVFEGKIVVREESQDLHLLLALGCANSRYMGSKRNRGFGAIKCSLWQGETNLVAEAINRLRGEG